MSGNTFFPGNNNDTASIRKNTRYQVSLYQVPIFLGPQAVNNNKALLLLEIFPTQLEDILAMFWWCREDFKKQALTEVGDLERVGYTNNVYVASLIVPTTTTLMGI
jgi:hypothetical protein